MKTKRFAGIAIAALFYCQAALGLVAVGIVAQKHNAQTAVDNGYGLTMAQAATVVQRY